MVSVRMSIVRRVSASDKLFPAHNYRTTVPERERQDPAVTLLTRSRLPPFSKIMPGHSPDPRPWFHVSGTTNPLYQLQSCHHQQLPNSPPQRTQRGGRNEHRTRRTYLLLALLCCVFLHALLHPGSAFGSMFFHLRLVLEQLLDRVWIRYVSTLLDAWASGHALFPRLERWELVNVDAGPTGAGNPAIVRDVCCGEGGESGDVDTVHVRLWWD